MSWIDWIVLHLKMIGGGGKYSNFNSRGDKFILQVRCHRRQAGSNKFLNWQVIFCQVEKFPSLFNNALQLFFLIFPHSSCTNKWKTTSFNRRSRSVFFIQFFFFALNLSLSHFFLSFRRGKSCKLNSFAQHRANMKNERKRLNCIYLQFCSILFLSPTTLLFLSCFSHVTVILLADTLPQWCKIENLYFSSPSLAYNIYNMWILRWLAFEFFIMHHKHTHKWALQQMRVLIYEQWSIS